ncbi:ankyrin repeat-containing protein BDA1-like [Ziziphus jujuba]|uniref:Ankyrin repeat-containing protein BDA1-like n=1 Tax=Ziziphus jujuba TaxID=326968 RepID=A0ABM3IEQ2_ZIZJJ|nr:ankyrin repeat-containing protein BDA1-like [Ziziphus jujuba]
MDNRLFVAAQTGNIQILHQLLAENPFILHTIELSSQGFNPLDIASTAGHVEFVKEIIRLRPDFAKQVNQDGFSPIHIAAALGNLEIVREFMKVDQKLCRLEGRNRWTALHYAASRGKVDTIQEMLLACPESIEDVTVQNETALHLAVKNCQFQAINFMVTWVREMKKDEILDMKDEHGNSILHLATWRKQRQVVEWLISNPGTNPLPLEVNAVNKSGLTALDVLLIFTSEAGDREIEEILRNAGARRARDMIMSLSTTPPYEITNNNIQTPSAANGPTTSDLCADNLVNYFKFKRGRDSPSDARTALLVIAVLVATATFQAGLNPPGGVWQDTKLDGSTGNPSHDAGRSILGSYASVTYLLFMLFNTIGFSVSIYMIAILISNFPFQWEFQVCIVAINFTYVTAITYMAPTNMSLPLTVFSIVFPFLVPHVFKLFVRLAKLLKRISEISGIQNHLNTVSELFWY